MNARRCVCRKEETGSLGGNACASELRKNCAEQLNIAPILSIGLHESSHAGEGAVDGDRANKTPSVSRFRRNFAEARTNLGSCIKSRQPGGILVGNWSHETVRGCVAFIGSL